MTTQMEEDVRAAHVGAAVLGARGPDPSVPRRRLRFAVGAVVCALLGAWVVVALWRSATERTEVLALSRPVERLHVLERGDLRPVAVVADPGLATVRASALEAVVGRRAAVALTRGALLTPEALLAPDASVVGPGEAMVGLLLRAGDAPVRLARGTEVTVVVRPGANSEGAVGEVAGWIAEVGEPRASGERQMSVVVPAASASAVSAAAAEGRVTLVGREG